MTDDPGEPSTGLPRVPVSEAEALLLSECAVGRRVLEIGTGLGVSTRALAIRAHHVHTIDIDPWVHETIWPTLPANVLPVDQPLGPYDLVFIDADHQTEAVRRDIATAQQCCRLGLIIVHDALAGRVAAALDDNWSIMATEFGLGFRCTP